MSLGVSEIDSDLHILEQRLKGHVETGMNSVLDIAQNISQCCQEDDDLKMTARQMMVDFIEMEQEILHQVTALNQIKQMMTARQMMVDFIEMEQEILHQVTALNQIKQMNIKDETSVLRDDDLKMTARQMMVDFIEMEQEILHQVTALNQIKQMSSDATTSPTRCLDEKLSELQAHNSINPSVHPKFKAMETKMQASAEIMVNDKEFESLRATLLGSTEEDDVALTQTEVNTKCPYSGRMMVNPVRNTLCGHVYDKEPILEHIKARRGRAKCPVGGCPYAGMMDAKKLVEHKDLKKYIDYINKKKPSSSSVR